MSECCGSCGAWEVLNSDRDCKDCAFEWTNSEAYIELSNRKAVLSVSQKTEIRDTVISIIGGTSFIEDQKLTELGLSLFDELSLESCNEAWEAYYDHCTERISAVIEGKDTK